MFGLGYKTIWTGMGALLVTAWGGTSLLVAQAAVPTGDFFSNGTWAKAGLLMGVLTGGFYAITKRLVSYAVDRIIKSWESLELNQGKMQDALERIAARLDTHIEVEREWQRGIEQRLSLLEWPKQSRG